MSADKKVKFDDLIRTGRDVDALRYFAKEYYDNGKMGHTRKMLVEEATDLIESLQAQLAELRKECDILDAANTALHGALEGSQRRADAAVEDLKDALYDPLTIDCGYCKYRGAETDEHVATTGGCHACENHGGFYDCFEWRGPQEVEKGAAK